MRQSRLSCFLCVVLLICSVVSANYVSQIKNFLQQHKQQDKNIAILQSWIQQPSLPGNEQSQQDLIVAALNDLHFDKIDVWELDDVVELKKQNALFNTPRDSLKGSPIVVGTLKGTPAVIVDAQAKQQTAKSVILNGHIDVVPVGDVSQWKRDPFSGYHDKQEQRIHGRGSTDMKGGIFSSLVALHALRGLGIKLQGDVIFESVIEEEAGGAGTMATIMRGYKADVAILPEPTNLKIFPKQQGSMWFRITVKGIAAHGGTRYEGISAIEKSMIVIQCLLALERKRNEKILSNDKLYHKSFAYRNITNPVPINVGKIQGGKWPSSVADEVTLEGRIGIAPGETKENAKLELTQELEQELPKMDPYFVTHPVAVEWFGGSWVPGNVDEDHPMVGILAKAFKESQGVETKIEASPWGTDGGYLTHHGTPAIVFGPGDTELAHQTDETVSIEKIYKCAEVIALALIEWCGVASL